ncbi:MAG TPA: hypothetical protein VMH77_09265 [Steroidobacteraceae bacterium]|nr:hypothetical protein [Steroidobacteraceae bacterium]
MSTNPEGWDMDQAQLAKIHAEIGKLIAESARINAEARWYPLIAGSGGVLGIIVLAVKLFGGR